MVEVELHIACSLWLTGGIMFRRYWLTLLLVLHFLPWPSSRMLFSSFFSEASIQSVASVGSEVLTGERPSNALAVSDGIQGGSEELLILCEADSESLKSEAEGESDEKSNLGYTFGFDTHNQSYSALISRLICLYAQILTGIKLSNPIVLRC